MFPQRSSSTSLTSGGAGTNCCHKHTCARARASVHKGHNHRPRAAAKGREMSKVFGLSFFSFGRGRLGSTRGVWPCCSQVHGTLPNSPRQSTTFAYLFVQVRVHAYLPALEASPSIFTMKCVKMPGTETATASSEMN